MHILRLVLAPFSSILCGVILGQGQEVACDWSDRFDILFVKTFIRHLSAVKVVTTDSFLSEKNGGVIFMGQYSNFSQKNLVIHALAGDQGNELKIAYSKALLVQRGCVPRYHAEGSRVQRL